MPDVICNPLPLQYLHQLGLLHVLPALAGSIVVPPAVLDELAAGRTAGVNLPEAAMLAWATVRRRTSVAALPPIAGLGPGETEVLMLALESRDAIVIMDEALARRVAGMLGLRVTGTLGGFLNANRTGLIAAVKPLLDQLHALRFRLAPDAGPRQAVRPKTQ